MPETAREDNVLIFDDSLVEKPDTSQNEVVMYHYDHSQQRYIKGICLVTALMDIPVSIGPVRKQTGGKTGKHDIFRDMLTQCMHNQLVFKHVLADIWYDSAQNMAFVTEKCKRDFIFPLKTNRRIKLSGSRFYSAICDLELEEGVVYESLIQGYCYPIYIGRYEVKNDSAKPAVLYLVTSDPKLDWNVLLTCYQKRWQVELFYRPVKQHAAIGKAPLRTARALMSHCYAAVQAFVKMEMLRLRHALAHDSIKELMRYVADEASYEAIHNLSTWQEVAYLKLRLFA